MEIQSPLWTVKPKANDQPPSAISLREQTSLRDAHRNHGNPRFPGPKRLVTAAGGNVLRNQHAIGGSEQNIVGGDRNFTRTTPGRRDVDRVRVSAPGKRHRPRSPFTLTLVADDSLPASLV